MAAQNETGYEEPEDDAVLPDAPDTIGLEIVSWEVDSHDRHARSRLWYLAYAAAVLGLLVYALATANFLFALILVIGSFVLIINDARKPMPVLVAITTEGVLLDGKFYEFDTMRHFAIVYKPHFNIKRLYFEFKGVTKHRLSLPLHDVNPLLLREELMKYLTEDLERTDEPLSESLTKFLKL